MRGEAGVGRVETTKNRLSELGRRVKLDISVKRNVKITNGARLIVAVSIRFLIGIIIFIDS